MPAQRARAARQKVVLPRAVPAPLINPFELCSLSAFGIFYRDGFLDPVHAGSLRSDVRRLATSGRMHQAGIGRGANHRLDTATRGDKIAWVDPTACTPALWLMVERLEHMRRELNQRAYLGLRHFQMQCSHHQAGSAGFKRHSDAFRDNGALRRLTVLYYLNPGWRQEHGGVLKVYLPQGTVEVEPLHNRLVVFLSEIEHEVTPVEASRMALTAFFYS